MRMKIRGREQCLQVFIGVYVRGRLGILANIPLYGYGFQSFSAYPATKPGGDPRRSSADEPACSKELRFNQRERYSFKKTADFFVT